MLSLYIELGVTIQPEPPVSANPTKIPDISATHVSAFAAVSHAIAFLAELLAKSKYPVPKGETPLYLKMRRDFPYVIHETKDVDVQILVNRNYKPLGNSSRTAEDWVDYEACKNGHVRLSRLQIDAVCAPEQDRSLFGDGNSPWNGKREANAYMKRLLKLRDALIESGAQ